MILEASLVDWHDNVDDLKTDAELIVEIGVKDTETIIFSDVPFTLSSVKVKISYKGLSPNKEITILETGGEINEETFTFSHNDPLKKGQKALLFLKKYNGPITEDSYVVLGVFQGKFKIKEDNFLIPSNDVSDKLNKVTKFEDLNL
jgi:hypothetical protein